MPDFISFNIFSPSEVKDALKQLEAYKKSLQKKCEKFVSLLADEGISVAKQNMGEYGQFVSFTKEFEPKRFGCRCLMVATQTGLVRRQWRTLNNATGIVTVDVAPLMMAEFGSGLGAENKRGKKFGMGTGTFPGQTHATDPGGWYWQDLNYEWHHSDGEEATMPMYHAYEAMFAAIYNTAKVVF